MKKFAIHTLGCKTNQLESATINDILSENGYQSVKFSDTADFYIINTCSVTAKSDSESMYYIRKARKTNSSAKIIVTGCFAQLNPEDIEADIIIGNAQKLDILEYIKTNTSLVSDIMQESVFKDKKVASSESKTRANIKIQDGCNNRCAYCIIPFARGKSRSNSLQNIIEQVKIYTNAGYKELVLTGIHIGQWGLDFKEGLTFVDLLKEIEKIDSLERYRLGSMDPTELSDEFIDFMASSKKIAHHIHISLQNANNDILKLMNRHYTVEQVKSVMQKLKSVIPDISLGCDVIVGFPTETDEQFGICYENISQMPFSYMHVFPYSIRPGTPAAMMPQVKDSVKTERAKRLRSVACLKKTEFMKSFVGQELEVLLENQRSKDGRLKGITSNYLHVLLEGGDDSMQNQILKAKVVEFVDGVLVAKV
ncbi:MAG: tRNA (N(6)-L-threonylcarbamoyladenosine(37)-C(2))-methylthiotransferase MtaB [Candidatus Gastranaerophilales bacterium]|nr:tRNA (N(6)-L-threonylcarbamoyladenosine(37)-C(2))-methylthiotransferase MtaB [Candidatus Gastranaerophilales bacterium]